MEEDQYEWSGNTKMMIDELMKAVKVCTQNYESGSADALSYAVEAAKIINKWEKESHPEEGEVDGIDWKDGINWRGFNPAFEEDDRDFVRCVNNLGMEDQFEDHGVYELKESSVGDMKDSGYTDMITVKNKRGQWVECFKERFEFKDGDL
jgi:hypothetical protein